MKIRRLNRKCDESKSQQRQLQSIKFIRLLSFSLVHLKRACEVTIIIFLKKNKHGISLCIVSNFHSGLQKILITWKISNFYPGLKFHLGFS